jgi:phage terminase large subunit
MTFTPLGANASWIFRELYSKANGKDIATFNLSIYDNPYLPPDAIKAFAEDPAISEVEKEARLYGRFQHLIDRVYSTFNEEVHVVSPFRIPDDWFCGMVVDPHSARPFAIAYFTIAPSGDIYIYKEWPHEDFTKIRKDSRDAKAYSLLIRELDDDRQIYIRLMDPNAGPRKDVTRGTYVESWVDLFAPYGLLFHTQLNDRLDYGEGCVRRLLAYAPEQPLTALNRPRLYVFDHCLNTIASLSYYTVATKAGTDAEIKEGERDPLHKDFADVVRYIAVSQVAQPALSDSPAGSVNFESYFSDESCSYAD